MALNHTACLWNVTPQEETGLAPLELFSSTKFLFLILWAFHTWGCPIYMLPRLQDGHRMSKWEPWSQCSMFVGFSRDHASTVGSVLSLQMKSITPQYHLVYDDYFLMMAQADNETSEPPDWKELVTVASKLVVEDPSLLPELPEEWLSPAEIAMWHTIKQACTTCIRTTPAGAAIPSVSLAMEPLCLSEMFDVELMHVCACKRESYCWALC